MRQIDRIFHNVQPMAGNLIRVPDEAQYLLSVVWATTSVSRFAMQASGFVITERKETFFVDFLGDKKIKLFIHLVQTKKK
jgi:hypothetical protein